MNARILAMVGLIAMMVGCPATTTDPPDPPYAGKYTENSQLVVVSMVDGVPAMADHMIPLPDLQGSDGDYGFVILPLVPKTTDPTTGQILAYEPESIGVLLASRRSDGKVVVLRRPYIQFDAIMSPMLGDERDVRFFGNSDGQDIQDDGNGGVIQPRISTEIIGLIALARLMGAIVETHNNHTTINTYNISSWCGWPYPAYPCRYGYGGGCGGPMGSVNNWHGYGAIPPCGGWWYGDTKDSDLAKAIPELPIDSVAPSGAIVVTQNMARIVIRYGYRLPDESAVQKNLTILLDNDGDGFTNIDEWDNGTDPNNTNSFPVEVPNVVGMLVPEATTTLVGAHLLVGNLYPQPSSAPAGTVLASSPVAGTTVHSGSRVNLAVSDGTGGGTTTTVPDVRGKTVSEAQPIITGVDLVVGNVNQEHSATVAVGLIIRSNPIAGTSVPTGSSVDLVVSSGPIGQAEVRIVNPPSGNVYHIGDTVSLTIMVKGATGGGPYSLLVQNGELTKITIPLGDLGIQEVEVFPHSTFTFHFVSNGSLFMASLFDHSQKVAESDVPYSVIP